MFNFMRLSKLYFAISLLVIVPGLISLARYGLKPGIDFIGGSLVELQVAPDQEISLAFQPDGTVAIKADCNNTAGSYTTDRGAFTTTLGPMTMAACPSDSRSDQFVKLIGSAARYFFKDSNLYIDLMADGGTLTFASPEALGGDDSAAPAEDSLQAQPWQWTSFTGATEHFNIEQPENYRATFAPDGTLYYANANANVIYKWGVNGEEIVWTHQTYVRDLAVDTQSVLHFSDASGGGGDSHIYYHTPASGAVLTYTVLLTQVNNYWGGDFAFDPGTVSSQERRILRESLGGQLGSFARLLSNETERVARKLARDLPAADRPRTGEQLRERATQVFARVEGGGGGLNHDTFAWGKARVLELCSKLKPLRFTWSCTCRVHADFEMLKAMKEAGTLGYQDNREYEKLLQMNFKGLELTEEKLEEILKGRLGDVSWANSFLEGILYNDDPVMGGFGLYVSNAMNEVMTRSQMKYNKFANAIREDLEKVGYNPTNIGELGSKVGFVDTIAVYDYDQEKMVEKKIWTFLNPWKEYRSKVDMMEDDIRSARRQYLQTGKKSDKKALMDAIDAKRVQCLPPGTAYPANTTSDLMRRDSPACAPKAPSSFARRP